MKQILGAMRKAIKDFDMIQEGDKIVVGISGGKDSMALLYALSLYRRFSPVKYELTAVTLSMGFENFDVTPVRGFCEEIDVPYKVIETEIAKIVFDIRKESNPCALCAKMRRGALHDEVNNLGYNKIALGHHADDAIETMFLSMLYEGRVNTFKPVTHLTRKNIYSIRPLIYVKEQQITNAIEKHNIPVIKSPCPMDKNTKREEVKQLLNEIYKTVPMGRDRLLKAIKNKDNFCLWW
ncbi:tRNA 2-thiocytidine(32) synthetase TtcA [Sedimentibacter sp. zth1]|uniref:tRNA 2-thiocytidine biosynthesis TtcA family protein n=1 Tax=Sedimentibacter sp. zth1 TaxID=2816908 RepID=UPI001A937472|nr:ATP-binding protein [Sedimentibacter sp. zth1]QSX05386.1 tRNA 2-thiocytidine(32) synthetase TtcA [Sedimentibacter sp. zth1]